MDTNTLFLDANRKKFRFETPVGMISTEDLWDLPLTSRGRGANLDDLARALHRQLKEADGDISFVRPAAKKTDELQAKFDVVKFVIDVKIKERDEAEAAADRAAKKQKVMEIISRKTDAALEGKSIDELQELLKNL